MKSLITLICLSFACSAYSADFYVQRCSNSTGTVLIKASTDRAYQIILKKRNSEVEHFAKVRDNKTLTTVVDKKRDNCEDGRLVGYETTKKVYVAEITLENDNESEFPLGIEGISGDQKSVTTTLICTETVGQDVKCQK